MKTIDDFAALHRADDPLVLFNVWDAGSAAAVAEAGAKAIATGSLSLAGAQGYDDGEGMPFAAVLESVRRIAATIGTRDRCTRRGRHTIPNRSSC